MSDETPEQNRIIDIGKDASKVEEPVTMSIGHQEGMVTLTCNPPVVRLRMLPRFARLHAMMLLQYAEMAENPPTIQPAGELNGPSNVT